MFYKSVLAFGIFATGIAVTTPSSFASNDVCGEGIVVTFREGAPVDKFIVENNSTAWSIQNMKIDLQSSKGRLIFDTIAGGKGVEVFQPYKEVSGSAKVIKANSVEDGVDSLSIAFQEFASGQNYTFSIDVDDQLSASELGQIRVTGSEMQQTKVSFTLKDASGSQINAEASFNGQNKAILKSKSCNT